MMIRFLPVLAAAALLGACSGDATGPDCDRGILEQVAVNGDTVTLSTGLRYIELQAGTGAQADWCDGVQVHYRGSLLGDTAAFDDSRARNQPLSFFPGFGELIPGFEQGVVGMQVGGTRRLIIPPALGYGPQSRYDQTGRLVIPANSTLVFDIELLAVQPQD